jgi:hypothetical protein
VSGGSFSFSPDGKLFAFIGRRGTLLMFKGDDFKLLYKIETGVRTANLAFLQDGQTLRLDGMYIQELRSAIDGTLISKIDASALCEFCIP